MEIAYFLPCCGSRQTVRDAKPRRRRKTVGYPIVPQPVTWSTFQPCTGLLPVLDAVRVLVPTGPVSPGAGQPESWSSALFIDAVTRVSFWLFGAKGELLAEVSEDGLAADFMDAYILLQNDLTGAGPLEMVGADETDPYDECTEQARNHGQYVSCVAHINNLLRRDGEISGREKGQRQRQAARKR